MNKDVKKEKNKLKKLVQFKNIDENAVEKIAQKNVVLRELVENSNFIDAEEKKRAKLLYDSFLESHNFDSISDLNTLSMLIYNMILLGRIQKTINDEIVKNGKTYISDKLLKSMHEVENQVLSLKMKLGIDRQEKTDELTALQLLKKRFHQHIQDNRNEFTLSVPYKCSECGKEDIRMILVRKRVKDFEALIHPHFSGRFWYNEEAIKLIESGKLSKEDYAKIFSTSVEYVDWCLKNKGRILNRDEQKSE